MLERTQEWMELVATGVELSAALVIGIAVLQAWLRTLRRASKHEVRLDLGRWLALALEFTLAADIVRTAVAPSWDDIGKLAAIAVLRTGLNHFLGKELKTEG